MERILFVEEAQIPGIGKHPCSEALEDVLRDHHIQTEVVRPEGLLEKLKAGTHRGVIISSSVLHPIDLIKKVKGISSRPIGFASICLNRKLRQGIAQAGASFFIHNTLDRNALSTNLKATGLLDLS